MKKSGLLLIFILPLVVKSQSDYWQQRVNYFIEVTLNDTEHSLEAFEKLEYINHSPDTLNFIWFHVWLNAYKNDRTAFSEQRLSHNRTDFYFSEKEDRGYINRLDFKVNGITTRVENHPVHIDIIKVLLPAPLQPGHTITITTPFHVKLPKVFSRGGHVSQSYQLTQWYPKPAVYDRKGWHALPYLDQGEFYSEFGDYDVRITLPGNYVVAATGKLQDEHEIQWLKEATNANRLSQQQPAITTEPAIKKVTKPNDFPASSPRTKTLHYLQKDVHDFAWFADKRFLINHDTLTLASGKVVQIQSFYLPSSTGNWKSSTRFMKDVIRTRSEWIGEYPYQTMSAVETETGLRGGMEYPAITNISKPRSEDELSRAISHEVTHNWFYGILASNERLHPWMDEGMTTYYDSRYREAKKFTSTVFMQNFAPLFLSKRIPDNIQGLAFETIAGIKKDQPINTSSEKFNGLNYSLITYHKGGEWMKKLETFLGRPMFDSCMQAYYDKWMFRHPYPEDFKKILESTSGRSVDNLFRELDKKGSLLPPVKRSFQLVSFFNFKDGHAKNYISIAPVAGYNTYDGFMPGALIHNYQLPLNRFSFFAMPLYAAKSKQFNVLLKASYSWYPDNVIYKVNLGINAARFSINEYQNSVDERIIARFKKWVPYLRVTFNQDNTSSNTERYIQFKSFFINEDAFDFRQVIQGVDTSNIVKTISARRNLNQLKFVIDNKRMLYPYRAEFQVEQQDAFVRAAFTGNYYFNYSNGPGGLALRLFVGKFFYTIAKTIQQQFQTDRYHLNLSGANGYEDYTYSNYFVGRNEFENVGSQQMMIRDGGFKVRTDLLSKKIGKTDDWLIAANFTTAIPHQWNPLKVLPFEIPLKLFADIGTFADASAQQAKKGSFLFDAGLQLSLLKESIMIYIPVIDSSVFSNYFKSTLGNNRLLKTISFSIDIQNFNWQKLDRKIPF